MIPENHNVYFVVNKSFSWVAYRMPLSFINLPTRISYPGQGWKIVITRVAMGRSGSKRIPIRVDPDRRRIASPYLLNWYPIKSLHKAPELHLQRPKQVTKHLWKFMLTSPEAKYLEVAIMKVSRLENTHFTQCTSQPSSEKYLFVADGDHYWRP